MRQKNKPHQKTRDDSRGVKQTKKPTPFDRETERRRREMIRVLGERTAPIQNKRLKSLAWRDAPKSVLKVMRAKPVKRTPRGT